MPNYTVFIVDDDPQMLEIMSIWLGAAGHEVDSDTAASTALPKIAAHKTDAVLVDLMMAEVDGLELVAELRARPETRETAIIMISARTENLWRDRAAEIGADGFIHKPLKHEDFVSRVVAIIEDKKAAQ